MAAGIAVAVIEKVGRVAFDQASFVVDFTDDFLWLKEELTKLAGYLKYVDNHTIQNQPAKRWIQQVRDVAWDAEDIIEEYAVESLYGNSYQSSCLCSYRWIIFQLKFRYNMGRRIKNVRQRMMSIIQDAEIVHKVIHLDHQSSTSRSQTLQEVQKPLSRLDSKSPHVAIEDKVKYILQLLQNPEFPVIAVVGMGGVGKTFLLQHVFSSIKQRFVKSIWLSISQKYSIARLQADLASNIKGWQSDAHTNMLLQDVVNKSLSVERAAELISSCLENTEVLVVLDDVWRVDGGHDLIRNLGLPTGKNSKCKIVVTTRSKDVAKTMSASYTYEMKVLSDEESWKLFCCYAFPDCLENRPPEYLFASAHAVERECGNLPLAVKTVGASMAHKTLVREWESKSSQLKKVSILQDSTDPIMSILGSSYDSLPAHLRPCFLYLAFFGEDEEIDCKYLVSCRMAEGFVPEGEGQWDLAFNYLYQLNALCLVEVEQRDAHLDKYCKVHDLLLDLAISICKENKCAVAVEEAGTKNLSAQGSSSGCRRILLAKKGIDNNAIIHANLRFPRFLRTLSLSLNKIDNISASLFSRVKVLRVIDLSRTQISTLPKCFGNLKLLKVLNLSHTKIREVPTCVRNLKSLCFLDLGGCLLEQLPAWIGELTSLQYLRTVFSPRLRLPKEISNLVSLRTLVSFPLTLSVEEDGFLKLKDVAKLINLQGLNIKLHHELELKSMEEGVLLNLVNMRDLGIENKIPQLQGTHNLPCFPDMMKAMNHLEFLCLKKFLLPSWMCEFASLRVLLLWKCEFSDYPALEAMPNLMALRLVDMENCKELPNSFGKSGGFPKLRLLEIVCCDDLEELPELKDGAMAALEKLTLWQCKKLYKVPEGLQYLKNLKLLQMWNGGTNEFKERLKEDGEDWKKLKANNPYLIIVGE